MTIAVNVLGWVGIVALLSAYWLVSTQRALGDSTTYQGMNLLGAILVIGPYGSGPALAVASDLDAKVEALLETAAGVAS